MSTMGRIVLFDLEETLIDNWSTFNALHDNIAKINASGILNKSSSQTLQVGLMSWAVIDQKDEARFMRLGADRSLFEDALKQPLDRSHLPFTADDYRFRLLFHRHLKINKEEFLDIFNKVEVLTMLARCDPWFKDKEIILVDDVVAHGETSHSQQNNASVRCINISMPIETWVF